MKKSLFILSTIFASLGFFSLFTPVPAFASTINWTAVPPSSPTNFSHPYSVASINKNDVWAVGETYSDVDQEYKTYTLHWDGSTWNQVPSIDPAVPSASNQPYNGLTSVSALSSNDVWAVGGYSNGEPGDLGHPLIEHWDGTSWQMSPSPSISGASLSGVTAIAPDNVWAVGRILSNKGTDTFIEHWDGTGWNVVQVPNLGAYTATIESTSAVNANDIWAVGEYSLSEDKVNRLLTLHWDGTNWSVIAAPNPGADLGSRLISVKAIALNDIWTVGEYEDANSNPYTLTEHWDGTDWSIVPTPNQGTNYGQLQGVTATGSNDVWAVGGEDSLGGQKTLTEHWDGTSWQIVPTAANPDPTRNFLFSITEVAPNELWEVGVQGRGLLIEHGLAPNTAPTVGTISVSLNPVAVNTAASISASFTDPDTSDIHTAVWNWGDGTTSVGTVTESNGSGSVSDSHTYTVAGVYSVTVAVTDSAGATGTQTYQYISVYNPTAQGLFSAGQKYTSPAGAYTADPSFTGSVKFGLSYKYQGTMPTGTRQFSLDFNVANLHFNATSVNSLVISNGIGTLMGTGTLTGQSGTYNFLVTGSESANTIRIQIIDPANNNAVIYDTQPGAATTTTPTTTVTGNIIAH